MVAEPGDADAQLLGRLHDRRALVDRDRHVVDGQVDFLLFAMTYSPHSLFTASNRQTSKHRPHLMQRSWSIMCGSRRMPVMHVTGQLRAQTVQPTHFSASIS